MSLGVSGLKHSRASFNGSVYQNYEALLTVVYKQLKNPAVAKKEHPIYKKKEPH